MKKLKVLNLKGNDGIESVHLKCNVILDNIHDEEMYEEEEEIFYQPMHLFNWKLQSKGYLIFQK